MPTIQKDIDFKLSNLLIDLDYQKHFSYEKRVDLFNKYGYSTSMLFFEPLYHLSNYIISFLGFNPNMSYSFGHGKGMLDKLMFENAIADFGNPDAPFTYKQLPNYEFAISRTAFFFGNGKQRLKFWYYPETDEFKLKVIDSRECGIPKVNVYDKLDEWLHDFGFKAKINIEIEPTSKSIDELYNMILSNPTTFVENIKKSFGVALSIDKLNLDNFSIKTNGDGKSVLRYVVENDYECVWYYIFKEEGVGVIDGYFEFMGEYIPYYEYHDCD